MTAHRASYRKTILAATLGAVASLGAIAWLAWTARHGLADWPPGRLVAWAGAIVVFAATLLATGLVAGGGVIALRRDTWETLGLPYASRVPREWTPGPIGRGARRLMRLTRALRPRPAGWLDLRPGELVEVKALEEILATLDARGTVDGLPFMPEMAACCGRSFRVLRRVDKLNDWVGRTGLRRVRQTVLLAGVRCDGAAHGSCQARCHVRWNEAWLRRSGSAAKAVARPTHQSHLSADDLDRLTKGSAGPGEDRYVCQVTQLAAGTTPLAWGDPRHYLRDLLRGNVRLRPFLAGVAIALFNRAQRLRGGTLYPNRTPTSDKTSPHAVLDLQPGERVRVRPKAEIEPTLTYRSRNRGLWFDAEMLRFCGGEYRVAVRVERLIDEATGKMVHLTTPCVILDGVTASGEYLGFCPQDESIFWREIWLTRTPSAEPQT